MRRVTHYFPFFRWSKRISALLFLFFSISNPVLLASDYYPPRVSHVEGTAAYIPAGKVDWEEVTVNIPVLTGDRVYAQPDSRLEIELGDANFLRLADETDLTFDEAMEKEIRLTLEVGVMIVRLNKSRKILVRTPLASVEIKREGLYRLGVDSGGQMQVIVRKGRAYVETAGGRQRLNDGEEIVLGSRYQGPMQVSQYSYQDEFDRWSDRRDARHMNNVSVTYVGGSYYPGIYDLDRYGYWTSYPGWGRVWIPHVAVGWSPFRSGFWMHFGFGFGWTWISHEPWGWLPYHYGSWNYYHPHRRWCWIPGPFRSWHPHRVHFYHGNGYVGWAPRPHGFTNSNNVTVINNNTVVNRPPRDGLTVVRQENFGQRSGSNPNVITSRQVTTDFRAGLPANLRSANRNGLRSGGGTNLSPGRETAVVSSRSGSRNRTPAAAVPSERGGINMKREALTQSPEQSVPGTTRTSRVLRAGGGASPSVVNLPPRSNRSSSRDQSQNLSGRASTPPAKSGSAVRVGSSDRTGAAVSRDRNTADRPVKRISKPAASAPPAVNKLNNSKQNGQRPSIAPNSSLNRSRSGYLDSRTAPPSSRRLFSRPGTSSSRSVITSESNRAGGSRSASPGYKRPASPSVSRSKAPSPSRSSGAYRAPSRPSPTRSYSRPSSPSSSAPSGRTASPSRGRASRQGRN